MKNSARFPDAWRAWHEETAEVWRFLETPDFSVSEMACHCACGLAAMDHRFMAWLQGIRTRCGFPFPVSSGWRCVDYNATVRGGPAHVYGMAADIGIFGEPAHTLVAVALAGGAQGVGISQRGPLSGRFIHLDLLPAGIFPRPRIWSY